MTYLSSSQILNIIGISILGLIRLIVSLPIINGSTFWKTYFSFPNSVSPPAWTIILLWSAGIAFGIAFAVEQSREIYLTKPNYQTPIERMNFLFFASVFFASLDLTLYVGRMYTAAFALSVVEFFWCSFSYERCINGLTQSSIWEREIWRLQFGIDHATSIIILLILFTTFMYSIGYTFVSEVFWSITWISIIFVVELLAFAIFIPEIASVSSISLYFVGLTVGYWSREKAVAIISLVFSGILMASLIGSIIFHQRAKQASIPDGKKEKQIF